MPPDADRDNDPDEPNEEFKLKAGETANALKLKADETAKQLELEAGETAKQLELKTAEGAAEPPNEDGKNPVPSVKVANPDSKENDIGGLRGISQKLESFFVRIFEWGSIDNLYAIMLSAKEGFRKSVEQGVNIIIFRWEQKSLDSLANDGKKLPNTPENAQKGQQQRNNPNVTPTITINNNNTLNSSQEESSFFSNFLSFFGINKVGINKGRPFTDLNKIPTDPSTTNPQANSSQKSQGSQGGGPGVK